MVLHSSCGNSCYMLGGMALSEAQIQSECVRWLWNAHPETRKLFIEVNNNPRHGLDGAQRKALGMVKGASDTLFFWKGDVYCIEFKDKTGRQSAAQKDWEAAVSKQGFQYFLIRDLCSFQELIYNILNLT